MPNVPVPGEMPAGRYCRRALSMSLCAIGVVRKTHNSKYIPHVVIVVFNLLSVVALPCSTPVDHTNGGVILQRKIIASPIVLRGEASFFERM